MIPYTLTGKSISFYMKGKAFNIASDHVNFEEVKNAVFAGDVETALSLVDIINFVAKITNGDVRIGEDEVFYKNKQVPEYLANRILEHARAGDPIDPICRFTEKLFDNPNEEIVTDLYRWIEVGKLPLYPDGDFLAFKVVRSDFTSIHSGPYGKHQNPGTFVEMPRSECDSSRTNTCSTGLHFCSFEYLSNFSGFSPSNEIVSLKINPADVTAIPADYNDTKGRTCKFFVVEPLDKASIFENYVGTNVVKNYDTSTSEDDIEDDIELDEGDDDELVFEKDGNYYSPADVLSKFANLGTSGAAKHFGIANSTMRRWQKKAMDYTKPVEVSSEEAEAIYDEIFNTPVPADEDENSWDEYESSWGGEVEVEEQTPAVAPKTFFSTSGDEFTEKEILDQVENNGVTQASRDFGIARSTLSRWINKIKG